MCIPKPQLLKKSCSSNTYLKLYEYYLIMISINIISNRLAREMSKKKTLNAVAHASQALGYAAMRDKQFEVVETSYPSQSNGG